MNFSELRDRLRDNLLSASSNVSEIFVNPEEWAEKQQEFPYITLIFGEGEISGRRVTHSISIIGIVKGEDDVLPDKVIDLKNKIFNALYNKDPKIKFDSINMTNLFEPFGIDGFLAPPYGGVRYECTLPEVVIGE